MRTLVGVLLVAGILVALAAGAVRGVRRVAAPGSAEEVGRTTIRTVVEGLIVIAAVILGVVIVVALVS